MSRSYKKEPVYKDSTRKGRTRKSGKQIANHVVRHKKDLPDGGGYRKAYCSYNISAYRFRIDEWELRKKWESWENWICRRFTTYQKADLWWKKIYRLK